MYSGSRLMKVVQKKKTIHNWPLFEVDPLDKWVSDSGKFILIGDASHAMVPYLSMGKLTNYNINLKSINHSDTVFFRCLNGCRGCRCVIQSTVLRNG